MADPIAVRGYRNQVKRYTNNARREAAEIKARIASISADIDRGAATLALGAARNMARDLAELTTALSALEALKDVEFLTDPDAKEA